jgi:hypothetical protein
MSSAALNVKGLRPKPVALKAPAGSAANVTPPPLPSMRVPKGTVRHAEADDSDREWALRAAESKARIAAAEEREWQAQLAKARALLATQEEEEWSSLRKRSGAPTRSAEEREWAELMTRARTRSVDARAPRTRPQRPPRRKPAPLPLTPAARPQAPAARVVLWP